MQRELNSADLQPVTREFILARVSQETLFRHYMGRPLNLASRFKSPIREDKHPTCTMAYFNGRLYFRDWALPRALDVFAFVMALKRCPYQDALQHIVSDFNLHTVEPSLQPVFLGSDEEKRKSAKKHIAVKIQPFTETDKTFLKSYHITPEQTTKFKVFSLKYVWLGGVTHYVWQESDPALGYYHGDDEDSNQRWKLYFYQRFDGKPRFLGNTNRISGWVQLPEKGEVVVMTKSMKDIMVLDLFGIPAVSMQSETTFPYPEIIGELKSRFNHVVSLYDFDYAGVTGAMRLRQHYGIKPLFLTDGRFGTTDYKAKDISDYIRANGRDATEELLIQASETLGLKPDAAWSWNQF